MRVEFDPEKSRRLRLKRGIGFEEALEIFSGRYYLDRRQDVPEQFRAIGWASGRLYVVIFETRTDEAGPYEHLITLWRATAQEERLYKEHA
jgi:uncharacterized DUF497 family protein